MHSQRVQLTIAFNKETTRADMLILHHDTSYFDLPQLQSDKGSPTACTCSVFRTCLATREHTNKGRKDTSLYQIRTTEVARSTFKDQALLGRWENILPVFLTQTIRKHLVTRCSFFLNIQLQGRYRCIRETSFSANERPVVGLLICIIDHLHTGVIELLFSNWSSYFCPQDVTASLEICKEFCSCGSCERLLLDHV